LEKNIALPQTKIKVYSDMIGGIDTLGFSVTIWSILTGFVISFVIGIILAVWVYKDAKKRDMDAAVWLLIVLITGCIGCIIYLIVRE
jgi:hypothetical protein